MRILNPQEVHFQPTDTQFRPSKVKAVIVFIVPAGIFSIFLITTFQGRQWVPFVFVSIFCVIILLTMGSWVAKAFKKDGWKVTIQNSAILLKVDITGKDSQDIIEIQFREIASLRKLRERYIRYKGGGKKTKPVRFDSLDIELTPDAYTQLEMLIGAEIKGVGATSPNRFVYPTCMHMIGTDKILRQIESYCQVQQVQVINYDMPDLKDKKQVDRYILFLACRGHKTDAQQCAREAFGFGLSESKEYVSGLMKKTLAEKPG